ncbi:MAG: HTTM domain-containing protein [Myxococcota bacterium]
MSPDTPPPEGRWARLSWIVLEPVDVASLVVFRIAFGALLTVEAVRYLAKGWVERKFIRPEIHFPFYGFDWLPHPGAWSTQVFVVLGVLGACVTIGFCYRLAAALYFVGFAWMFLLEQAYYLNHLYLVCLLAFLAPFLPAHRAYSLDARLTPGIRADRVSGWALFLLRAMFVQVYTFAGIAKLNPDSLRAQPLLLWLEQRGDYPCGVRKVWRF